MKSGAREDYLSWDDYFMSIAKISSLRSKDPNRQVGCCLVEPKTNKILSIGYNGFPRGCCDNSLPWNKTGNWLDTKYPYVVHAEINAIVNASTSLDGSTAYVTLFPCNECAKVMIQSGIKKVCYENDTTSDTKKASERMFTLANIQTIKQESNIEINIHKKNTKNLEA